MDKKGKKPCLYTRTQDPAQATNFIILVEVVLVIIMNLSCICLPTWYLEGDKNIKELNWGIFIMWLIPFSLEIYP